MENVVASKQMDQKVDTGKIYCTKCEKEINNGDIDRAFKITVGLIIKHDFFPAEKTVYYHQDCL